MRVVTGVGIYLPNNLTVSSPTAQFTAALSATNRIWSDMMPVASGTATNGATADTRAAVKGFDYAQSIPLPNPNTPYLRMRATAVYHYNTAGYDEKAPKPIACVSSYYDATNKDTARNQKRLT
ncbi:MAG: hypothetical protein HC908_11915 [Calothrix sp. SM1_7_51]|nr:hypothetical protein [Calothrix sp. SM1_7_51]